MKVEGKVGVAILRHPMLEAHTVTRMEAAKNVVIPIQRFMKSSDIKCMDVPLKPFDRAQGRPNGKADEIIISHS